MPSQASKTCLFAPSSPTVLQATGSNCPRFFCWSLLVGSQGRRKRATRVTIVLLCPLRACYCTAKSPPDAGDLGLFPPWAVTSFPTAKRSPFSVPTSWGRLMRGATDGTFDCLVLKTSNCQGRCSSSFEERRLGARTKVQHLVSKSLSFSEKNANIRLATAHVTQSSGVKCPPFNLSLKM